MSEVNRREFVALTVGAAAACACGEDLLAAPATQPAGFDAGPLSDFAADGMFDKFANKKDRLMLKRTGDKLIAFSAACTHKGCIVKVKGDILNCPCHSSKFELSGKLIAGGQAKASLFHHAISLNADNHVIVDRTKLFGEAEWDKEEASLTIPKA